MDDLRNTRSPVVLVALLFLTAASCAETGEFFAEDTQGSLFDLNIFSELGLDASAETGPKAGFGEACADSMQCQSKVCLKACSGNRCSKKCSKGTSSCGAGYGCVGVNGAIEPGVVDYVCVQICEAGVADVAILDAAVPDVAVPDAAIPDVAVPDAAVPDTAVPDKGCAGGSKRACYTGPVGTKGVGTCASGLQTCAAGVWGSCLGAKTPTSEVCNNKDDDCDGKTDELLTSSCYTAATSTLGVGLCKAGKKTCSAGTWGSCAGQVIPAAEKCDTKDNDCDGFTDEGLQVSCYTGAVATLGIGLCKAGKKTCSGGKYGACVGQTTPVAELCDNMDNDCDGFADDGLSRTCYTGAPATQGKGLCKAGKQTCGAGKWGACTGQVVPVSEKCDNKDNDCDGSKDESLIKKCTYTGKAGTEGVGLCKAGESSCSSGSWAGCTGQIVPSAEACDNKDNDCDGYTDEALSKKCPYTGKAGTEGVGVCKAGKSPCSFGKWGGCTGQVVPSAETCDTKDNDCDGSTDVMLSFTSKKWCGKGLFSQTGLSYNMDLVATFNGGKGPTFTFGGTMTFSGGFVGKIGVKDGSLKCRHAEWKDGAVISGGPFTKGSYKGDFSADGKTLAGGFYWYGIAVGSFTLKQYACP